MDDETRRNLSEAERNVTSTYTATPSDTISITSRATSKANVIWLLLQKEDPFVAGGVPVAAYEYEQATWDDLALRAAEEGYRLWRRTKRYGGRMSHATAIGHVASMFEVWRMDVVKPDG